MSIIRGNQDIIGTFIFGGVFERHPNLKIVCVEADAGWVPHFMYRMDHAYNRHRYWMTAGHELSKMPSEYFRENVYMTFQDDWVAFKMKDMCNSAPPDVGERLPAQRFDLAVIRRTLLAKHTQELSEQEKNWMSARQRRAALRLELDRRRAGQIASLIRELGIGGSSHFAGIFGSG